MTTTEIVVLQQQQESNSIATAQGLQIDTSPNTISNGGIRTLNVTSDRIRKLQEFELSALKGIECYTINIVSIGKTATLTTTYTFTTVIDTFSIEYV